MLEIVKLFNETTLTEKPKHETEKPKTGDWPSGSRCFEWIGRFPAQTPLGPRPGLGTQPRYEAPSDLHKMQWLQSGE